MKAMRSTGCPAEVGPADEKGWLSRDSAAGPSSVGEDTNASTEHLASYGAQSRTAPRPRSVDCNRAEGTTSLVSAQLQQSKTGCTAALIRAIAAADPGVGRASRKRSPA